VTTGILIGAGDVATACAGRLTEGVDHIVAFDRDPDRLTTLQIATGPKLRPVHGDIDDEADRNSLAKAVTALGAPITWAVLTAGAGARGMLSELDPTAIRSVVTTNVISQILILRTLLGSCEWAPGSRIVGLGSISARRPLPGRSVYGASKAAYEAFLRALAVELAPRRIAVNVVSAGVVDSSFIAGARADLAAWATDHVPLARLAEIDEVADVITYLSSSAPGYLTGARLVVDGGTEMSD
jgi:NAD(P)-dependent dehydrogenase (short-subunit alcohol dehydrogenase family)